MYTEKFNEAFVYASHLHAKQYRKGSKIPYITHLMSVAALVGECGGSETAVISALLHDAVEDQGGAETLLEIRRHFGEEVAQIVSACSDTDVMPKPPWKERKLAYIRHIGECNNESVLLVSCADKLHNFRSIVSDYHEIGDEVWKRFTASKEETLWYYKELSKIYQQKSLLKRLSSELESLLARF
jgi:(p)ppGpp synthase/HD superfamily hydrolase